MPPKKCKISKTVSQVNFFKPASQSADPKGSGPSCSSGSPTNKPAEATAAQLPSATVPASILGDDDALNVGAMRQLLSQFKSEVSADIRVMLQSCQKSIDELGERTDHLETKMGEVVGSHNDLITSHEALQAEVSALRDKVSDLEDRSRRNNLKIRGIPETIPISELHSFTVDLFQKLLPKAQALDLLIDRIHRLPKPKNAPEGAPRDVLMRIHYFHIKEALLKAARPSAESASVLGDLQLFGDLSQATLAKRRSFHPVTSSLRKANISYRWGFPTRLLFSHDGSTVSLTSPEEGMKWLSRWNISTLADTSSPTRRPPSD